MENNHEIRMIGGQDKLSGVCRIQQTVNGPPKLILAKPSYANKRDHNTMPYNYGYTSNIQVNDPSFQTEISRLTWSGRCFTPEELRKTKGKEVVDVD